LEIIMSNLDLYETVTNQIIAALEAGTPPWQCPWRGAGVDARPANATSGRMYRGINVLLLNLRALVDGYSTAAGSPSSRH
jgi:antirestriction protein ArdC